MLFVEGVAVSGGVVSGGLDAGVDVGAGVTAAAGEPTRVLTDAISPLPQPARNKAPRLVLKLRRVMALACHSSLMVSLVSRSVSGNLPLSSIPGLFTL